MTRLIALAALALCLGACSLKSGETTVETKPVQTTGTPQPAPKPAEQPKEAPVKPMTEKPMMFELQVLGMSWANCTAAVTRLLEGVEGVEEAKVNLETGRAIVTTKPGAKVTEAALRQAVEQDYEVESCVLLAS